MSHLPDGRHRVLSLRAVNCGSSADAFCGFHLAPPLTHGNHTNATSRQNPHEFQSDRPAADDNGSIAGMDARFLDTSQNTGKRLHESSIDVGKMRRNFHHILTQDASRDKRVFGVCPVVEKKVLTEIGPVPQAEEAIVTRRRVGGDHPHAGPEAVTNGFAGFFDNTRQLVAEERRRRNHAGMVSLLPDLEIGPAGKRYLYTNQKVIGAHPRDRYFLDFYIFAAVQV